MNEERKKVRKKKKKEEIEGMKHNEDTELRISHSTA